MSEQPDFPMLRKAIDSTVMLVLARFLMPVVLAVVGYFMTTTLTDLKAANQQVWEQLLKVGDAQARESSVQAAVSVKVDDAVKQLDRLQAQVDGMQRHN